MTRLVFATWGAKATKQTFYTQAAQVPVTSVLATFAYPSEIEGCVNYARQLPGQVDLWLDSGAFTAWKSGAVLDVRQYAHYLQKVLPLLKVFRRVFAMSLDEIPGTFKRSVTAAEVTAAAQRTLENTQYLMKQGLNVVPIHHQGEPLWVMQEYLKLADYVGVSPANDSPFTSRVKYLQSLLPLFKSDQPLHPAHNFGNVSPGQLMAFPCYSADSQTWKMRVMQFGGKFDLQIFGQDARAYEKISSHRAKTNLEAILMENIAICHRYERDLKKLWAHRGVTWREPLGLDLS